MSLWSKLWRRRSKTSSSVDPVVEELPEMSSVGWYAHLDTAVSASAWTMLNRLPVLVGDALGFAWRASKTATIAALALNTLAAAATTFGLLATQDVAQAVLGTNPTWDTVTAAIPALLVLAAAMGARAGWGIAA
jgi:ATP-binding cassette subfamily B protein